MKFYSWQWPPKVIILLSLLSHHIEPALSQISYRLVRTVPRTKLQVDFLHTLRFFKQGMEIEFWRPADSQYRHVDIWVSESSELKLLGVLRRARLSYSIVVADTMNTSYLVNASMKNMENFDNKYHTYRGIVSEILRLTTVFPDLAKLIKFGRSHENYPIYGIEIRKSTKRRKNVIFVNCGSHGREWLAIASCVSIARELLFNYKYDKSLQHLLQEFRLIIIPVLNVDGYIYSFKTDRYWRKSRSPTHDGNCVGVDINRNFLYRWGGSGSSADPCDDTFSGTRPFSESETLCLARYLYSIRDELLSFIDVHTFGQLWMSPWGYTTTSSKDYALQEKVMSRISKAIQGATGKVYRIGSSSHLLYRTSGDSTDWAYGFLGVVHSYAVELRPEFGRGKIEQFVRPTSDIQPTGKELLASLKELGNCLSSFPNARM